MSKATILIVEDSPDISQVLADAFRFADFTVLQASTAVEALQLTTERQPGLIFMDIQLPDLDGLSVAQTLKGDPATRHIPIVAMTAYDVAGNQARLIGQLCVGHCQKPFSPAMPSIWPRPSSSSRGSRPRDPSGRRTPDSRADKSGSRNLPQPAAKIQQKPAGRLRDHTYPLAGPGAACCRMRCRATG